MEDLYIESNLLETDLADLECDECGCYVVEVNASTDGEDHYVTAFTREEVSTPERLCDGCADKRAAAYKGTVHDRREDPEELLREILLATMNAPTAEALGNTILYLAPRISRR